MPFPAVMSLPRAGLGAVPSCGNAALGLSSLSECARCSLASGANQNHTLRTTDELFARSCEKIGRPLAYQRRQSRIVSPLAVRMFEMFELRAVYRAARRDCLVQKILIGQCGISRGGSFAAAALRLGARAQPPLLSLRPSVRSLETPLGMLVFHPD
jgi:hypothetical protein